MLYKGSRKDEAKAYILSYLSTHPCVDCGESDIVVLEFDHRNDKTHNITEMIHFAYTLEQIKTEIAKCDVRCANCHRRRHAVEGHNY